MATATEEGVPNEDQGPVILGATLTVTIAALITMITRLYVRIRMIRNVGWDDYVMISAMILVCHLALIATTSSTSLLYQYVCTWDQSIRFTLQAFCCDTNVKHTKLQKLVL
jgi:hypothetical protein